MKKVARLKGWCQGCGEYVYWRFVCQKCLGMFCYWCRGPDGWWHCFHCFTDEAFRDPLDRMINDQA